MNERKLSELQKSYRAFFLDKMRLFGIKSPADLIKEQKSTFFMEVKQDWAKFKLAKREIDKAKTHTIVEEPVRLYNEEIPKDQNSHQQKLEETPREETTKKVLKSEPNKEQTAELRILFSPNNHFEQEGQYRYPVVKMPLENSHLKLPRAGRTNQFGYKENDFFTLLKLNIVDIEIVNDVHMVIPNFNRPYEPDIVLFDKGLNLYIDIEIDEPYDGYYRYSTHNYRAEDNFKQDNIRDLFFTESGWVVIRFTERQIAMQPDQCVEYVRQVINSICKEEAIPAINIEYEEQWDENLSIQWQKSKYRESYLGIPSFNKRSNIIEVIVDVDENESVETVLCRTASVKNENGFDEELHKYFHKNDETGNAEYISVTTLIDRFFPFDILRYIQKEAERRNMNEEYVLIEFLALRDEAAEKGTELHKQIENYLAKKPYDGDSTEFRYFLNFEETKIKPKELIFVEAEKRIISNRYNVAGTVDCLYRVRDSDKYVMIDWKRSKKLVVKGTDGSPDKRGFKLELNELKDLNNCSYYKYAIQQNMYKLILETEYGYKISSMVLAVLHENNPKYFTINLPIMERETMLLLNSLNHKI